MTKYYKKERKKDFRKLFRILSLIISFLGLLGVLYIFFPLISWQVYFAPIKSSPVVASPIPKSTIVNSSTIGSLVSAATNNFSGIDYKNAQNWFPTYNPIDDKKETKIQQYFLSIPKLQIKNATVSTVDYDLAKHLINYGGTSIPPKNGNAVIFGHSTLPYLFNPNDYTTIFATLYKLETNDEIFITLENITYKYKIFSISVVNPDDTSIFSQNFDDSYITLVTCTPPGTTWKRLIIKAKIEKL